VTGTVLEQLVGALDHASAYDGNALQKPVALLWPDRDREWESVIGSLRSRRKVVTLGAYDIESQTGPAYWVRCVVEETLDVPGPAEGIPIIYLPGFSRQDLQPSSSIPSEVGPLVAIHGRSEWFCHPNGRDWTIRGLFSNSSHGFALSVAGDDATSAALVASIGELLDQPMSRLRAKHLDSDFLNRLLSPDPIRSLLNWLNDPVATRGTLSDAEWAAFLEQCKQDYDFDPGAAGEIDGARRLGGADGPWAEVWKRYQGNPEDYLDLPDRLREAQPVELLPQNPGHWPALADDNEELIRNTLSKLAAETPEKARSSILTLDASLGTGRGYVWARLGRTPLVLALEYLAEAARLTVTHAPDGSVEQIADWYATDGWRADRACLLALNEVDRKADQEAVSVALQSFYVPWMDAAARSLQDAVGPEANSGNYAASGVGELDEGEVVVFIDGLRLDVAHMLGDRLTGSSIEFQIAHSLAALPTVTATSKPSLVPIDQSLLGPGKGLDACRAPDGPSAGIKVLRSLMKKASVQVLTSTETGDPEGTAWTEAGEIDHKGHDIGLRLALEIDDQVDRISARIRELLEAGWKQVTVVTDHGWLLVPGGMPKNENLPPAATEVKKGRCARVKDGAVVSVPTVTWHWDSDVRIAVASGISCFEANQTYEHGGVSPQECVVPRITVTRSDQGVNMDADITKTKWRGLSFVVEFASLPDGAQVDLRMSAGDPDSSIAELGRITGGSGKVILLVEDEDLEGQQARLVVVKNDGAILIQRATTVGQNR